MLAIRSWSQALVGGRSLVPWLRRMVGATVRGALPGFRPVRNCLSSCLWQVIWLSLREHSQVRTLVCSCFYSVTCLAGYGLWATPSIHPTSSWGFRFRSGWPSGTVGGSALTNSWSPVVTCCPDARYAMCRVSPTLGVSPGLRLPHALPPSPSRRLRSALLRGRLDSRPGLSGTFPCLCVGS